MNDRPFPRTILLGRLFRFALTAAGLSALILALWYIDALTVVFALVFVAAGAARLAGRV